MPLVPRRLPCQCRWVRRKSLLPVCWANILVSVFQIKDDIFDYFDSKKIGKPTGNDMLEGKLTLPALYALNTTKDAWAEQMAFKVKEGTATPDEIVRLIEFTRIMAVLNMPVV